MRNPPDIKRGLFICADLEGNCPYCPYAKEGKRDPYEMCVSNLVINALHYIQQLETENHQLLKPRALRWISVEERLPGIKGSWPYCQHVAVLTKNKEVLPGLCNGDIWYVMRDEDAYCTRAYDGEVTHWMPRIEPPEEE